MEFVSVIVLLVFLSFLFYYSLNFFYRIPDTPDELHFVQTGDNLRIVLHRYHPAGGNKHGEPVFLCHGLGANKYNLDMDERYSLARYLSRNGYDCWVISLRGAESWSTAHLTGTIDWQFNFDTFVEKDLLSAIDYIIERTGKRAIHWVGHSMGGMLLYAYVIHWGGEKIKSGITLGSPVRFKSADRHVKLLLNTDIFLRNFRKIPLHILARLSAPFTGIFKSRIISHQMNPENVDFRYIRRAQFNAVTPLSTHLLKQFKDWLENDEFRTFDKSLSYKENLDKINIPVFVIAGKKDKMALIEDVKYAYEKISSKDKKYIELSRENGFSADYGHIDMVFGKRAPEEIFPVILDWFEKHRG